MGGVTNCVRSSIGTGRRIGQIKRKDEAAILMLERCVAWTSGGHDATMSHAQQRYASSFCQRSARGEEGEQFGEADKSAHTRTASGPFDTPSQSLKERLVEVDKIS